MLYFDKPLGIERTYSEEEGLFCEILGSAPDIYHKINPKGRINTYRYDGELLRHLLIETRFMDFEMISELGDGQAANTMNVSGDNNGDFTKQVLVAPKSVWSGDSDL